MNVPSFPAAVPPAAPRPISYKVFVQYQTATWRARRANAFLFAPEKTPCRYVLDTNNDNNYSSLILVRCYDSKYSVLLWRRVLARENNTITMRNTAYDILSRRFHKIGKRVCNAKCCLSYSAKRFIIRFATHRFLPKRKKLEVSQFCILFFFFFLLNVHNLNKCSVLSNRMKTKTLLNRIHRQHRTHG